MQSAAAALESEINAKANQIPNPQEEEGQPLRQCSLLEAVQRGEVVQAISIIENRDLTESMPLRFCSISDLALECVQSLSIMHL